MKDITIILTSVGGPVGPSHVSCLKAVKERKIKVIGVDASSEHAGRFLVDIFVEVPLASDEDAYIKKMLEIARQNNVDAIVPSSDIECLVLSKNRDRFEKIGVKLICPNYDVVKLSSDKFLFCKVLQENGLPSPEVYSVKTLKQFREAAQKLGYPAKAIVMKPRFGTNGGRGMRILDEHKNKKDILFSEKTDSNVFATLPDMEAILHDDLFPELVVSEYLPMGIDYDVDLLARDGKMLICASKARVKKIVGLSLVAVIDQDKEIENLCRRMCEVFKFSYNINVECKRSAEGIMVPFEINPRIAATISLPTAAGANLIYLGIKLGLGEEIPKVDIKDGTKIFRHLQGVFVHDGELFSL